MCHQTDILNEYSVSSRDLPGFRAMSHLVNLLRLHKDQKYQAARQSGRKSSGKH